MSKEKHHVIIFAGKKSSGKNSCANFILGIKLKQLGLIEDFRVSDEGKLLVQTPDGIGEFSLDRAKFDPAFADYAARHILPHINLYAFADPLKEYCIASFGLTYKQCYGTEKDKNTKTKLKWEDMPYYSKVVRENKETLLINKPDHWDKKGFMTAREVLQYFGTEVCRQINPTFAIEGIKQRIDQDQSKLSIITDGRFKNEVVDCKTVFDNPFVVKLTRQISTDTHKSENDLNDLEDFRFSYVLDNSNLTIPQQNKELLTLLLKCEML